MACTFRTIKCTSLYLFVAKNLRKPKICCTFAAKFETMARGRLIHKALKKVHITAVRQTVYLDLMVQYENPIEHACTIHEGQEWVSIDAQCPEGFCAAAWETMREFVGALAHGHEVTTCNLSRQEPLLPKAEGLSGMHNPMSAMISCNDGFRPFSFYIEVIDEPTEEPKRDVEIRNKRLRGDGAVDERVKMLVRVIGKASLPRRQLVADLQLRQKSRRTFVDHYMKPAYYMGLVDFAYPNSPTKPEQAYKLTPKGLELLATLNCEGAETDTTE